MTAPSWVPLRHDQSFRMPGGVYSEGRLMRVSLEATGLLVLCIARACEYWDSQQQVNYVDDAFLSLVSRGTRRRDRLTAELADAGLLVRHADDKGWSICDDYWRPDARRRKTIDPATREAVFACADYACEECGSRDGLSIDHIYPWSKGGTDDIDNLRCLCTPCNSRKGARV